MVRFRLSLNITEDWDLICLFHNLRSPTPTALCRNVLDAYLSGQSVQMPVVDLEARVPKDAKKQYWITLTDEQTEFLSSFDARRRSSVVRLLLRKGLWEYCLKLLGAVETTIPESEVKHHTKKTDVRSANFNSEPLQSKGSDVRSANFNSSSLLRKGSDVRSANFNSSSLLRKGSDVRSANFNSSSSLRENEDDKLLRQKPAQNDTTMQKTVPFDETKREQETTSVSGTNSENSFLGAEQSSMPVSALDLFNSIIGEDQ